MLLEQSRISGHIECSSFDFCFFLLFKFLTNLPFKQPAQFFHLFHILGGLLNKLLLLDNTHFWLC